jgi:hypothetical protein
MAEPHKPQTEQTPKGLTVPVPKRDEYFGNLKKAAKPDPNPEPRKSA